MKKATINPKDLQPRKLYAGFEGGSIHTAERDGRYYVIVDESTLFDLLSEEDMEGLEPIKVLEFESEQERAAYLAQRYPKERD